MHVVREFDIIKSDAVWGFILYLLQEEMIPNHGSVKVKLPTVLSTLALTGATTGTFLDGIHSRAGVLVYDQMPFQLGGLFSSAWVPPLLACFYIVLGTSIALVDLGMSETDSTTRMVMRNAGLARMALSFGTLAAMLWLSSYLYMQGYESSTICSILAGCAALNYLIFDSTKQGLVLAVICAVGAPAAELLLMGLLHLWHYPAADFYPDISGGMLRWIPFCYFFYVPAVANLSRYLWKIL